MAVTARARHALEAWAWWVYHRRELGWPPLSCVARAQEAAQGGSSRPEPGPRIPRMDKARLGPAVDRLLRDMDEGGARRQAQVLRAGALHPRMPSSSLAAQLGISPRTYRRAYKLGLQRLDNGLALAVNARA